MVWLTFRFKDYEGYFSLDIIWINVFKSHSTTKVISKHFTLRSAQLLPLAKCHAEICSLYSSDSLSHRLCFSVCIQLHFFNSPCQRPFICACVSVCIQFQISLSLTPRFSFYRLFALSGKEASSISRFPSFSIAHSWYTVFIVHFSSTDPSAASDSQILWVFPVSPPSSVALSTLACSSPPSLSISICLSGHEGFSQGRTLTLWNGVSLFLHWRQPFAGRITTLLGEYGWGRKKRSLREGLMQT